MRHWLLPWSHDPPDDPVRMACEATEDGLVPRMTEHFRDGRRECRVAVEDGRNTLLHQPFELPSEDADEFTTTEISAEEFERRWTKPF